MFLFLLALLINTLNSLVTLRFTIFVRIFCCFLSS